MPDSRYPSSTAFIYKYSPQTSQSAGSSGIIGFSAAATSNQETAMFYGGQTFYITGSPGVLTAIISNATKKFNYADATWVSGVNEVGGGRTYVVAAGNREVGLFIKGSFYYPKMLGGYPAGGGTYTAVKTSSLFEYASDTWKVGTSSQYANQYGAAGNSELAILSNGNNSEKYIYSSGVVSASILLGINSSPTSASGNKTTGLFTTSTTKRLYDYISDVSAPGTALLLSASDKVSVSSSPGWSV